VRVDQYHRGLSALKQSAQLSIRWALILAPWIRGINVIATPGTPAANQEGHEKSEFRARIIDPTTPARDLYR